jgi:hypothetical protein
VKIWNAAPKFVLNQVAYAHRVRGGKPDHIAGQAFDEWRTYADRLNRMKAASGRDRHQIPGIKVRLH